MNQSNERNHFDGNTEESRNNQASNANQGTNDYGETAGTFTDAVAGAMIGAPFGLIGAVLGGVTGGVIGNQMVEGAEVDNDTASKNGDVSNNSNSKDK